MPMWIRMKSAEGLPGTIQSDQTQYATPPSALSHLCFVPLVPLLFSILNICLNGQDNITENVRENIYT